MKHRLRLILFLLAAPALGGCLHSSPQQLTRTIHLSAPPPAAPSELGDSGLAPTAMATFDLSEQTYRKADANPQPLPPADGPLKLTIEQAVLSALTGNRALIVEQLTPVIAGTFVASEQAVFDPVLTAGGSIERYRTRDYSGTTDLLTASGGDTITLGGGITQKLPSGTDVTLDITQTTDDSDDSGRLDEARIGLNLTQALLRGAGIEVNLAGIHRAEAGALASAYNLRGYSEYLVATVETTYWDYALAVRQVEIFEESFSLAQRQRDDIHTRIAVGQLAETEEIVADAELALRRQQLIDARNHREQARLILLRLLNPPSADGWDRAIMLKGADTGLPDVQLGTPTEHEALAIRLRPDLNEARLEARQGKLETVQTANGLLPRLDLFITLGKTGYADSFSGSFKDLDGSGYDIVAGLNGEFPVLNRDAKAIDRRAAASYQQALQSVANLEQLIALEVRTALLEVDRSRQQIDASAARRVLQEEVLRSETVRFRVGTATALDVARVQRDLLESRINEVEAIINYRKALTNLYRLDGTLLLRRGINGPGAEEVILAGGS